MSDFNRLRRAKDGRQPRCRACHQRYHYENWDHHMTQIRARKKRVRAESQAAVLAYLAEHPCVDCGESDVVVLEFDHQRDKSANVSALIAGASGLKRVFEEIEKCEVVCANCHRRRTMRSQKGYRLGARDAAASDERASD